MKLIVAGGRKYRLSSNELKKLHALVSENNVSEIVHGGCSGVDTDAGEYAEEIGIKVTPFDADWENLGMAAGPIRNRQMAEYADAVALFPGGRGTASMYNEAVKAGIKIFDFR